MKFYLSSVILFEEVVNALKPRKIVGLDIRKRYVGVAITDLNFDRAYPHSCLERMDNNGELALQIHRLMKEWGAGSLIVGEPNDDRLNNPDLTFVQNFVNDLKKTRKFNGVKYAYVEERYKIRHVATLLDPFYINHEITKVAGQKGAVELLQDFLDGANRYGYREDRDYRSGQDWDV